MLQKLIDLLPQLHDFLRGRAAYMYRRPRISWASRCLDVLGKTFLREKLFTYKEAEAEREKPKAERKELKGIGPITEYQKKEFYYWIPDRTITPSTEHYNSSILLSIYRRQVNKESAWRVFLVSLALCFCLSVGDHILWNGSAMIAKAYHAATYSLTSSSLTKTEPLALPSKVQDFVDGLPGDFKPGDKYTSGAKEIDLDVCADTFGLETAEPGTFLHNIKEQKTEAKKQGVIWYIGQMENKCGKLVEYHPDMIKELEPFKDKVNKNRWRRIVIATYKPENSGTKPETDFDSCPADLQTVINDTVSRETVERAARCLAHGSTLETK